HFLYYFISEAFWARTPGKYLMKLRVAGASGTAITFEQALARTAIFSAIALPSILLQFRMGSAPLLSVATVLAYVVTMRPDNLFAGLHEIVSGTRVMADWTTASGRADVSQPMDSGLASEDRPLRFGPYRALRDLWRSGSDALVLGFDELLHRNVWVH